jgi:hypothetical protein
MGDGCRSSNLAFYFRLTELPWRTVFFFVKVFYRSKEFSGVTVFASLGKTVVSFIGVSFSGVSLISKLINILLD